MPNMLQSSKNFFRQVYGNDFIDDIFLWESLDNTTLPNARPTLTSEQQELITLAMQRKNVLVDACVGSGKTTSIQALCDALPSNLKILYLTYSKLLKLDAKAKIHMSNVTVTNYHGFAFMLCKRNNIRSGVGELVQNVIRRPISIPRYDVLVLDEYQDLEEETARLVTMIKDANPGIQIIAVGDMKQKIFDKTTLPVWNFINEFLGEHETLNFTQCFRLCASHSDRLSRIWGKRIVGVNENCKIALASKDEIVEFLGKQNPSDVLCLGQRTGQLAWALNDLEENYPEKYNKRTIYASIRDSDSDSVSPNPDSGIFTTYDGCKGLERKICVIFDFVPSYWLVRVRKPNTDPEILRNRFMVAASRGKELIVFVEGQKGEQVIDDEYIQNNMQSNNEYDSFAVSDMFDFKYREDVEKCFEMLNVSPIELGDHTPINIKSQDALIDLSPCIGIYQEARFFTHYDIDKQFELLKFSHPDSSVHWHETDTLEEKILKLTAVETEQQRYCRQVELPFVQERQEQELINRLSTQLSSDEDVQRSCTITVWYGDSLEEDEMEGGDFFEIGGICDVYRTNEIIELKFVSELQHTHFLQLAMYLLAFNIPVGRLWNVRTNTMWEVSVRDPKAFFDQVVKTITKGTVTEYRSSIVFTLQKKHKVTKAKQKKNKQQAKRQV